MARRMGSVGIRRDGFRRGGGGSPLRIAGDKFVSGTLSIVSPAPGASYQWYRDGSPIGGEVATTYTLVDADEGTDITVRDQFGRESNARLQPTIPPGLIAVWEAWTATPDGNGQLDTCPDRTGGGNTGVCPAALGVRPVLAADALFNNQQTAAMAGSAGHTLGPLVAFVQGLQTQPNDVYWVGAQPNVGGTRINYCSGNVTDRHIGFKLPAGFGISSVNNLGGGSTATTPVVVGGRYDDPVSALFEQDPATPANVGPTGNRSANGLTAAGSFAGAPNSQTFAGIFFAHSGMNESERRALFAYCYWRWKVGIVP